jgi:hypothetical protein
MIWPFKRKPPMAAEPAPAPPTQEIGAIDDSPDYVYCKHCGRVLVWDDWSYVHLDGWANCRRKDDQTELDETTHAEVLKGYEIEPQPQSVAEAWSIPIIAFVIGEDGTKYPWRKGDPMPVLTVRGDSP